MLFCCARDGGPGSSPVGAPVFSGLFVKETPRRNRLTCAELFVLAMLAFLIVLGLAANGLTIVQSLVALAFGAAVLGMAWLWQDTYWEMQRQKQEQEQKKSPDTDVRQE